MQVLSQKTPSLLQSGTKVRMRSGRLGPRNCADPYGWTELEIHAQGRMFVLYTDGLLRGKFTEFKDGRAIRVFVGEAADAERELELETGVTVGQWVEYFHRTYREDPMDDIGDWS